MSTPDEAKGVSRRRVVLLAAWVVAGWGSALLAAPRLRGWLEEYRSRTVGPSYGLANDAAAAMSAKLVTQERIAELLGIPADKKICTLTFTDHERTFVDAQRPERARPETGWLAVTVAGRSVLGRYTAKLWKGDCADPTYQYYEQPCTKVARIDLVERREIRIADGPAEPSPLLAGQCVWKKFTGKPGVIGRYRVWLPAERIVTVRGFTLPANVFPSYRLTLGGQQAPNVEGERTIFRSMGDGEYELEIAVQSSSDAGTIEGEYTLQVHWGHGVGEACPVPSFDKRECYGVDLPKESAP